MWAMRLNIVDWGYFKIQTLQVILKIQNQHQAEFRAFFGSHTFVPISWMCKKQTSVSHSSTESYRWMLVCVWTVYLRLTRGIWSLKCWERPKEYQNQPKHGKPVLRPKSHRRLKKVLDQNVDLSNIDQDPSNAHLSEKESELYIFEDNEAVIKMIIKGRSPTMRHVSRTHRVALDWLFDSINLDPKIQVKYIDTKNQLADILTKGRFTRIECHNLLHLFNIMNDTTFSCLHLWILHSWKKSIQRHHRKSRD